MILEYVYTVTESRVFEYESWISNYLAELPGREPNIVSSGQT